MTKRLKVFALLFPMFAITLASCAANQLNNTQSETVAQARHEEEAIMSSSSIIIPQRSEVGPLAELTEMSTLENGSVRDGWPTYRASYVPGTGRYLVVVNSEADAASFRSRAGTWLSIYTLTDVQITDDNLIASTL